jgi:hypothetical protein
MFSLVVFFATIVLFATVTFALAADEDWQVIVYEHHDYQGKSVVYSIQPGMCQRMEPELSKVNMNDKVTSVKVGRNVAVWLFEHSKYSGQNLDLHNSVQSLVPLKFNDKVSSLIVYPKSMYNPLGAFYPASETCGGADYPHLVYNDDATSVIIPKRASGGGLIMARVFDKADFLTHIAPDFRAGPSGGEFQIVGINIRRKASAIKIFIIEKPYAKIR